MFYGTRWLFVVALGVAAVLAIAFTGGSAATTSDAAVVNFFNWSDYIDDDTLPAFEEATGIKVNYDVYDSNDVLEGKLLAGSTGYDIVVPSGGFFEMQRMAGLFLPLDKTRLPNFKHLDPVIMAKIAPVDPGHRFAVPYAWGTTGLGINVDAVAARLPQGTPLDTWRLIFDPRLMERLADCGVTFLNAADELHVIALNYLGFDPHSHDLDELRQAMALLEPVRPFVRYFHSSQYIDDLANGEVCVAMGWSGDIYQAKANAASDVNISYVVPSEGTFLWFDLMAIPADAPHPEQAHRLLNHLLKPQVAAGISNFTYYASPNLAAKPYIDPAITSDPTIYVPTQAMDALFVARATPPKVARIRNRLWTTLKSGNASLANAPSR